VGRKLKGVRWKRGKQQARVQVNGQTYYETFGADALPATIKAWQEQMRDEHDTTPVEHGSIEDDVLNRYLPTVVAKKTYKQIVAHLTLWLDALGRDRTRASVTTFEIDCIMQGWLTTPSVFGPGEKGRPSAKGGLNPQTIRKRRTSLRSFFVKMNGGKGKPGPNPVTGSWCPKAPKPEVRGTDYATIAAILEEMPEWLDTKKARRGRPAAPKVRALGRLRCAVIAHTGIPPGVLGTIAPRDVSYQRGDVRIAAGRDKGEGVPPCTLELTADGLAAFKALADANGFGPFATGPLNVSFKRAAKRLDIGYGLTVYDLRHSFGSLVYETTADLATVGRFLMHAEGSTVTARYAAAANKTVDRAAATAIGASLAKVAALAKKAKARGGRVLRIVPK
jgi:integrase